MNEHELRDYLTAITHVAGLLGNSAGLALRVIDNEPQDNVHLDAPALERAKVAVNELMAMRNLVSRLHTDVERATLAAEVRLRAASDELVFGGTLVAEGYAVAQVIDGKLENSGIVQRIDPDGGDVRIVWESGETISYGRDETGDSLIAAPSTRALHARLRAMDVNLD